LDFPILAINEEGLESGSSQISPDENLPWLQDVDQDANGISDVWYDSWDITFRDVIILDETNSVAEIYNVTPNDLGNPTNYNTLRLMLLETATSDGDFDNDDQLNATDIDLLYAAIGTASATDEMDLNGDSTVDSQDVTELVENRIGTRFGDIDLDGSVNLTDFNVMAATFDSQGQNAGNGWNRGNFDGDTDIDLTDFNSLASNFDLV
jgi:hypothetical protein